MKKSTADRINRVLIVMSVAVIALSALLLGDLDDLLYVLIPNLVVACAWELYRRSANVVE